MTDADHKFLVDYLRDRDETCPACKYNLRNLTGVRCPECGEELQLRVSPVEPRQAAPIAGLIGLSLGLGMNALMLVYFFTTIFTWGSGRWGPEETWFLSYNGVGALVHGALLLVWLARWRWLRRTGWRWPLVALAWILSGVNAVVFAMTIR